MITTIKKHTHAFLFFLGGLFLMLVGPSLIPISSAATQAQRFDDTPLNSSYVLIDANGTYTYQGVLPADIAAQTKDIYIFRTTVPKNNTYIVKLAKYSAGTRKYSFNIGPQGFNLYNKLGRENIFNVRAKDSRGNIVKEYGVHIYAATVIGTNAYNVKVSERRAAYKLSAGGNIPMACIDTDGGRNYVVYGVTVAGNGSGADHCEYNVVTGNYNGRVPYPNNNCQGTNCYLRENYCLSGQRTYEDVPALACSGGVGFGVVPSSIKKNNHFAAAPEPVTIACDDFTTQAECPSGAPGTACNWDGRTCIENSNLRAAGGGFGFDFIGIDFGFRSTEEALTRAPTLSPIETSVTKIALYFNDIFQRLFDAFAYNIKVIYVKMINIRYGFEELQRENTLLRQEIVVLQNEIGIVAKSRIMPMEQKIGALEDAYNTAKLSRRAKYVQGLADTFTKLGMPEKAAALLEANGARTAAGNHTAAGNSNNSF